MFRARVAATTASLRTFATGAAAAPKAASARVFTAKKPQDFFDDSQIPTYAFQDSLPKLPLPKLNSTLDKCGRCALVVMVHAVCHVLGVGVWAWHGCRYLTFVEPLVDAATFEQTKADVEAFRAGPGPDVQAALVTKDTYATDTSYIAGACTPARKIRVCSRVDQCASCVCRCTRGLCRRHLVRHVLEEP